MGVLSFISFVLKWVTPGGVGGLAIAYWVFLLYLGISSFRASDLYDYFLIFTTTLLSAPRYTHIIGVLASIILLVILLWKKRTRSILGALPMLLKMHGELEPGMAARLMLSEKQVQKRLMAASAGAEGVLVYAGDGGFLLQSNKQHDEICSFGNRCKILLNRDHAVPNDVLEKLHGSGVGIRRYKAPNPTLRGRLVLDSQGNAVCLFARKNNMFEVISTRNQYISNIVLSQHQEEYSVGQSAYVRHLLFGLGGTLVDGDYDAFEQAVREKTNLPFLLGDQKYLCIDNELASGKTAILDFIEEKLGKTLDRAVRQELRELWTTTWTGCNQVKNLVKGYQAMDFTVSVISNCDSANRTALESDGWFDHVDHLFFADSPEATKPTKEFFDNVLDRLDAKAFECVVIDDQRAVTERACEMGMSAVLVGLGLNSEARVERIVSELAKLGVQHE